MRTPPVVVFAIGNPSRGDDALGPALYGRLLEWVENAGLSAEIDLIEDFQLNIEHALDLRERRLALFIDAGAGTPAPFAFYPIVAVDRASHSTHALAPEAVLQVYRMTEGDAPPPAFVLCIAGSQFELGAGLSPAAASHLAAATAFITARLAEPSPAGWAAHCTPPVPLAPPSQR